MGHYTRLLVSPCVISYMAVFPAFTGEKWKARVWFLLLPPRFYLIVLVGIGFIYSMQETE